MHGIYSYTPETNHVSRVYSVGAVLYLQFVLHVMLREVGVAVRGSTVTIPVITGMHGIYSYIPETNHVSRVYSVGTVLYLQFVLHVMLRGVGVAVRGSTVTILLSPVCTVFTVIFLNKPCF